MARTQTQAAQMAWAETAARAEIHRLLSLFPSLQAEFNGTGSDPVPSVFQGKKGESARARAARLKYQKEYRERRKQQQEKKASLGGHSASARKKLSEAMKARWAAAKAAGHALNVKTTDRGKKKGKVIDAADAIQAQLSETVKKSESPRDRKNRLQREWRAARKGKK